MNIFAISDLHLSTSAEKPMDIFGYGWTNHFDKISADWKERVKDDDIVLLGGDMSWAISLDEAQTDYDAIGALPGKKFVVRGNHDYYWNSLNKMRTRFPSFNFIQNNSFREGSFLICGTRGWTLSDDNSTDEDKKIYARELGRLKLSLESMQKQRTQQDTVIAMLHYPPFEADYSDSDVTALLEEYSVDIVLYGHLHGKNVRVTKKLIKNDITYYLTSCDLIGNKLVKVF